MKDKDFIVRYPSLSSALYGEFHDNFDATDDESARRLFELVSRTSPASIPAMIAELNAAIAAIDDIWEAVGRASNSTFTDSREARSFLEGILKIWSGRS